MSSWEQTISSLFHILRLDSIKSKILVFALLATLIPSLTLARLSYLHNKRSLQEKITAELQNVSSHTARETDLWLKERFYDVRVFSNSYEVSENLDRILRAQVAPGKDVRALRRLADYLKSVRQRFIDYEELSVIDPQARVVATSTGRAGAPNLPADWLSQTANDGEILGEVFWDEELQQRVMTIAVPILAGDGRFLGALTAKVNFRTIDETLRSFSVGNTGHVYVISRDGTLLVSSRLAAAALRKRTLATSAAQGLFEREGASLEYSDYARKEVVGTLHQVPRLGWGVVAEITTQEAYTQIVRLRNQTLLIVSGLLLGIGLTAYLLGLTIVRPLDRLTSGATKVAAGDLEVDVPVMDRGEVGYMTEVFNDMVARLRHGREELERLSITDGLTGLYNRRHLVKAMAEEVARCNRYKATFAVLMIDIDHFKKYNDTFGHLAGDDVLIKMGSIITECIREVDHGARYGGEEFLVMLPDTGVNGAAELAERLRTRVAKQKFAGRKKKAAVTLSVGVAEFPKHGGTTESVIAAADAALYSAKQSGRNRVVRATVRRGKAATRTRAKKAKKRA